MRREVDATRFSRRKNTLAPILNSASCITGEYRRHFRPPEEEKSARKDDLRLHERGERRRPFQKPAEGEHGEKLSYS
ncbi:hypothetical protein PUN28_017628 [Cardiocondyla obscurior]|uniref:Uncharacterized protein n=1 Tax=Cardiocondyla obscurior TaxID=286306 RepID=A0AAW2EM96_9HYME